MTALIIDRNTTRRITWAIFTSQSLFAAAFIAMATLMSIIAVDLSGSDLNAGLPATLLLLGHALAAYPVGWLMDRVGRRLGLSLGYLLAGLGAAISVLAIVHLSFWLLLVGAMVLGFGRAATEQSRYAAAEVHPLDKRAKAIGLIVFAGTAGAILGPRAVEPSQQLSIWLGIAAESGPWVLAVGLLIVAALVTFLLVRPDPLVINRQLTQAGQGEQFTQTAVDEPAARPLRVIFRNPMVRLAVAAMAVGQLVMVLLMVITPLHMDYLTYSTDYIAWAITAHTLGMFGFSSVTGWLIDRFGQIRIILAGAFILVVSALLTPLASALPILYTMMFLLGLGWNFCFIAGSAMLSDALRPNERGRAQGASDVAVALASGSGSFGTGVVFASYGYGGVGMVGLGLVIALIGLLAWTVLNGRRLSVRAVGD